jgi:DNA-binding CsgD family transcriptional regulator
MTPTARQLEILEIYAATGSYKITARCLGITAETVSTTLARLRCRYGVATTIQAYRAAVAAGHLSQDNVSTASV